MRASVLVASALIAAVGAAPAAEPVKIVTDVVDVFTTVFVSAPAATPQPAAKATSVSSVAAAQPVQSNTVAKAQVQAVSNINNVPFAPSSGYVNAYNGDVYARRVIDHHNVHRANHSAAPVTWDANLAAWAYEIANKCVYQHDRTVGPGGYGQNILAGANPDDITGAITESFYNGEILKYEQLHGYGTPKPADFDTTFESYGHFTQLVWNDTTTVGCATVDCTGRGNGPKGLGLVGDGVAPYFTVCNYLPPGNWPDNFDTKVKVPLGWPTVTRSYRYTE